MNWKIVRVHMDQKSYKRFNRVSILSFFTYKCEFSGLKVIGISDAA